MSVRMLPPWKNAAAELFGGKYGYGDVVSHNELYDSMSLPKPKGLVSVETLENWKLEVLSQIELLKAFLLEERNICLRSIPGRGYEIVPPEKQTDYAVKQGTKKVRAELRRMGQRLSYIDRSKLTHEDARKNADALAKLAFLQQSVKRANRKRFLFSGEEKENNG